MVSDEQPFVDDAALRLLIVADDPLARAGLAQFLDATGSCHIVAQLDSHAFLEDDLEARNADVVVWDLGWETAVVDLPELSAASQPVVVLLADQHAATEVWAAGARVILQRDMDPMKILSAAAAALHGLIVLDRDLGNLPFPIAGAEEQAPAATLTPRETEVLQLLAEGLTNKAIAQRLAISDHTVKFHVNSILTKLGVQSRTEAVVRATRLGLIAL